MPGEIKFSSFGIPYLVEFANISIRSKNKAKQQLQQQEEKEKEKALALALSKPKKLPPPPVRCPTCGHLPPNLPKSVPSPIERDDAKVSGKGGGLYIRFQSQNLSAPPSKISENRLARLRWAIAKAVTQVGMSTPASEEAENIPLADGRETIRSTSTSRSRASKQLFRGTYGQVKEALKNAGLTTSPCDEDGFEHATRLGALFVVNSKNSTNDGLELTKLTLWG